MKKAEGSIRRSGHKDGRMHFSILFLLLALVIAVTSIPVCAATKLEENGISRDAAASITVQVPKTDEIIYVEGTGVHLYKVADLNDDLTFSLTSAFSGASGIVGGSNFTLEGVATLNDNGTWMTKASQLESYVKTNGVSSIADGQLKDRKYTFTLSNNKLGLYLVLVDSAESGSKGVTYQPVLSCVPYRVSAKDEWTYQVVSENKAATPESVSTPAETEEPTPTPKKTTTTTTTTTTTVTKTGDTSPTELYIALVLLAAAVIIIIAKRSLGKNHDAK